MTTSRMVLCLSLLAALGCGATSRNGSSSGSKPDDSNAGGANGSAGSGGGGAATEAPRCSPPPATLTRLSFREQVASVRALLGDELADELALEAGRGFFPPLASATEGSFIVGTTFERSDALAQRAGQFAREHFAATACTTDDFDCVRDYVSTLAERGFRRPLGDEEQSALLLVVDKAEALGVTAEMALEYGVYAIFEAPQFLYRSELGASDEDLAEGERRLTHHELASLLSYYLTGGPPDSELLAAAAAGALQTEPEIAEQTQRLLSAPASRLHLQRLLADYFDVPAIAEVVLDPAYFPTYNATLAQGMQVELETLLGSAAWSDGVGNLLTTRRARVNTDLAALYGVTFPPTGGAADASGFADVELPKDRAGLLTRAGWVTLRTRPDGANVVGRGAQIMSKLLCQVPPPFPPDQPTPEGAPQGASEREQADYRMSTAPCLGCHADVDRYGLAVDDLDGMGRYRSEDAQGRPIDASVTLPDFAGGANVNGALELSQALPETVVATCLSQRFLEYALAPSNGALVDSCEVDALAQARAESGDQTLSNVVSQIARSRSFRLRRL